MELLNLVVIDHVEAGKSTLIGQCISNVIQSYPIQSYPFLSNHIYLVQSVDIAKELEKRQAGKELLNLVVIGHVDAGKSTLMGHLLYLLGQVNQRVMHKYETESRKQGKASFAYAWVLDETEEERGR